MDKQGLSAPLTNHARLQLIAEVYDNCYNNTSTFRGVIGTDMTYLCGAIAKNSQVQFNRRYRIVRFLRGCFDSSHPVWRFITLT